MVELLHELGHALHLVASSCSAPFKAFSALHLPLDVLEVGCMKGLLNTDF